MKTITKLLLAFVALLIALLHSSCEKNDVVTTDTSTYQAPKTLEPNTNPGEVDDQIPGEFINH